MASILNVDKIRANGSTTDGMIIDSSGRVTTPARPAFFAGCTGTNNQTSGTINYNSETFDIGGNYDPSTKQFTAPVDGVYQFSFSYYAVNASTARAALYKNGTTLIMRGPRALKVSSDAGAVTATMICELSANDTAEVKFDDGNVHTNIGYNYFCGHLVG
jgi:hypothetical protein